MVAIMASSRRNTCFATCAPGLEPLLHEELRGLRLSKVERQVGGCYFEGDEAQIWQANMGLRTAVRVLVRLSRFQATDADALYEGVAAQDWSRFLQPTGSLRVDAKIKQSKLDHSQFVEQRVKDAVVDQFQAKFGVRPTVDKDEPDLRIGIHLFQDRVTLQVDSSGHSLHRRGYRQAQGLAPLAETLAAAILLSSQWNRRAPVLDPFMGSGTILVEAAMLASGAAPALYRPRFGFENWEGHDAEGFERFRQKLEAARQPLGKLRLVGRDLDPERLDDTRENLAAAGFDPDSANFDLGCGDALDFPFKPGWNALLATNPPYGQRVGDVAELVPVFRDLGKLLRRTAGGYEVSLLSGDPALSSALALPELTRTRILNGAIECELLGGIVPEGS